MNIRDLLVRLRASESDRRVSRDTGLGRVTVRRYRQWAQEHSLLDGTLLPHGELQQLLDKTLPKVMAPQNQSSVEPYRELVVKLRAQRVEMAAIHMRLKERGFSGSYGAVWRFVHALEPKEPDVVVRVETAPGEEIQVDFGDVGLLLDPKTSQRRKGYAFVMTLSWSRHAYVEFVFDQRLETWLLCHVHAFNYFGGVPQRITCDNLKAAIIRAAWNEPEVNRAYQECAEHYGFLISPCRPRTPEHKGKVESGVHYVQRNFMAGRDLEGEKGDIVRLNQDVRAWCLGAAGQRIHGTTKQAPLVRFNEVESEQLRPLPLREYDLASFKKVKLHRDCYVVFEGSYYSAPFRMVGQELWIRAGLSTVQIYDPQHQHVASHDRATQPGQRKTHIDHLPAEKVPGLMRGREQCQQEAQAIGAATQEVVQQLLDDPVVYRVPVAGRLLRLAERYTPERLEAACARALHFGDPSYTTIKRVLQEGMDSLPLPQRVPDLTPAANAPAANAPAANAPAANAPAANTPAPADFTYARAAEEMVGHLLPAATPVKAVKAVKAVKEGEAAWV